MVATMTFVPYVVCWSVTCVYVDRPSSAKYLFIALAVTDLPRVGNRCPSDEDRVPVPNTGDSGNRWW